MLIKHINKKKIKGEIHRTKTKEIKTVAKKDNKKALRRYHKVNRNEEISIFKYCNTVIRYDLHWIMVYFESVKMLLNEQK